jgi:hypothetical protein
MLGREASGAARMARTQAIAAAMIVTALYGAAWAQAAQGGIGWFVVHAELLLGIAAVCFGITFFLLGGKAKLNRRRDVVFFALMGAVLPALLAGGALAAWHVSRTMGHVAPDAPFRGALLGLILKTYGGMGVHLMPGGLAGGLVLWFGFHRRRPREGAAR